jgi:prevent-host-death family protein
MHIVTIHDARTHLSRLLRLVERGEEVTIARGKLPIAKLVPFAVRRPGRLKGRVYVAEDFDAPLTDGRFA